MAEGRNFFAIKPPGSKDPGKYLLLVQRSAFGGSPTVFAVDQFLAVTTETGGVVGYRGFVDGDEDCIIEFPAATSYLLVRRNRVTSMSAITAAKKQKAEDDRLEKIFGEGKSTETVVSAPGAGGQYL